jgi:hypothetical protein
MKSRYVLLTVLFILLTQSSCLKNLLCERGNGIAATEVRRTGVFNKIENSTSIDIIYKRSDTTGITIKADENLLDYIITETNNNTLEIRTRDGNTCLDFDSRPVITITSPGLESIFVSGSGTFVADEMTGNNVSVKMSGSGDLSTDKITCTELTVTLSGSGNMDINNCTSVNSDIYLSGSGSISVSGLSEGAGLRISGSGKIYAANWMLSSADAIISGSGDIFTNVEKTLTALISGSGNIYLKGDPIINQTISGSGRIIKY